MDDKPTIQIKIFYKSEIRYEELAQFVWASSPKLFSLTLDLRIGPDLVESNTVDIEGAKRLFQFDRLLF